MSDDPNTPNAENDGSVEEGEESGSKSERSRSVANPLTRPTDAAARPGFRSPSNKRSKAQKKRKKKR